MDLHAKQWLFVQLVAQLILEAQMKGYELTFGECYRTPEQAALNAKAGTGIAHSLHTERLAIDVNLFINGLYQTTTEAYRPLGEWWEQRHELCRWGGRFSRPDGNHFSLTDGGRA